MKERILYIDIAKAICIILVVVGHYVPSGSPEWWITLNDIIYKFHVPLFMFASGFVYIATKKENQQYWYFIMKKIKRLMVPYFVVSFLVITIKLITESHLYVENPKTVMSYIRMFYYPEAGYFLWFIWALWWMFVIIPLFKSKNKRLVLFILSVFLAYSPFSVTDIFCLMQFKSMFVYFMLGVIVYDWKNVFSHGKKVPSLVYVTLFLFLFILEMFHYGGDFLILVNKILPYIGIASVISLSRSIARMDMDKGWLLTISASSYMIYLFHTTFEGVAKAVVLKTPLLSNLDNNFYFIIGAIIVIGCGIVVPILLNEYVFKKYNLTKILFGLK